MPPARKTARRLSKPPKKDSGSVPKTSQPHDPSDPQAKNQPDSQESIAERKVDTAFEKKIGCSAEALKKLFTAKPKQPEGQIEKLKKLLRDRVIDARRFGLNQWRVHMAADEAYRAPFRQITPTLIGKVMAGNLTISEISKELQRLGLPEDNVFTTLRNPDGSVREKILTRDTYSTVKVPIVRSMLNAREAKLFSERDRDPFMVFEPTRTSEEWSVVGEIITKLVSQMATSMGWKATYREANHQRLKYSCQLWFPQEAWYVEEDTEDGKEFVVKEGLRYNIPPSTRCGFDQTHRPSTFNSDTGCDWGTYWRLKKFSDVDRNPAYYNKDKIAYSTEAWLTRDYEAYFKEVYPCAFPLPTLPNPNTSSTTANREQMASTYTTNDYDKAIFETDIFCKLSPKEWGFSEYKPKVWFRFVMASDAEVVYGEPLPFCPVLYLGSDADDASSNSVASFALEIIPWQDMVGNLLSDIVSAMQQNAIKVIFYDKLQITPEKITEMIARAKEANSACWFGMDWRDLMRGQVNTDMLFKSFTFPQQNIGEKIGTLNTVFNVMERALGISAQEVGAIAGHIQTKAEIDTVAGNVGNRVGLITSMDDDFFDAWKRQIVRAMQAFMDEDFAVEVSAVPEEVIERMKKEFSFQFENVGKEKMRVKGKKSKLSVDAFLSTREGRTRTNNQQLALVMFQSLSQMAGTDLAMRIGPERMVQMWNRALEMAGVEERDRWKLDPEATSAMENKKLVELIQKFSKEIVEKATEGATAEAAKLALDTMTKQVSPAIQKVGEVAQAAGEAAQQAGATANQAGEAAMQVGQGVQMTKQEIEQLGQIVMRLDQIIKRAMMPAVPIEPQQPQLL